MSARDNGGWAFPQPMIQHANGETYGAGDWDSRNGGMTLRDWFAGQAMAAIIGGPNTIKHNGLPITGENPISKAAYAFADAMLAERVKGGA